MNYIYINMHRFLFLLLLLFASLKTNAQSTFCKDSLRQPDPYYRFCGTQYEPVCGCDNVTYRNPCSAENWGGLINTGFYKGYTDNTVCGTFDYDIYPTAFGLNLYTMNLSFFTKLTGTFYAYVYDPFGRLYFQQNYYLPIPFQKIDQQPIDLSYLPRGIYEFIVIFNGEKKSRKIAMIKYE